MAFVDTGKAIGAVTNAITDRLKVPTGLFVSAGRPEPDPTLGGKRLNLFLYEAVMDSSLKNMPLDDGQRPPIWLVLKYLMTAFDDNNESDSLQAYEYLGQGIRALDDLSVLTLPPGLPNLNSLTPNPEELKISFDDANADLISKVMQGPDEKYRMSVAFQVRPVMIVGGGAPSYSLLVGVDYTTTPITPIGEAGIHTPVIPSMGPTITDISPLSFEIGSTVTVFGTDLHLSNLSVNLGPVIVPVTMQQPDRLQFLVDENIANGGTISAGSLPVSVSQLLSTGRRRASNVLIGNLIPNVTNIAVSGPVQHSAAPPPPIGWSFATIDVTGKLLGKDNDDDSYLALFRDGATVKLLDRSTDTSPAAAPQTQRQFAMQKPEAVPPGPYLAIYRVNRQQALESMMVDLT
jgi:hypothetical protein